jgi:TolB-like protein/DNA-binding winged helix-turn-helix (wHTH) protein/Tfp pilus assembly protein PilF
VRAYELRSGGIPLKLKPIPMKLLLFLVERRGELVTREQIVERIWGNNVFLDTDNGINGAISRIRQVLRDDVEHPRFVQTISGKGYRFSAPVTEVGMSPTPLVLSPQFSATKGPVVESNAQGGIFAVLQRWRLLLGISVVLVASLSAYFMWSHSRTPASLARERLMLAVLPFENLTGDPAQEYFSDGLTEEMITQLGNLEPQHLGVIARTSVMHYKNRGDQLDEIGRKLGVQYVLEGSVRRDSGRVRVTAQLIQIKDQSHVWARQYDRELNNVLTLQGEIGRAIAHEIQLTLTEGHEHESSVARAFLSPQQYDAYDLYLKGEYFSNKRTPQGLQQAIEYFEQAIAKDPTSARAYAGLADSYALIIGYNGTFAPQTMRPRARAAAMRAIELDEGLAEAHTALAVLAQNYDWDWQTAEREYLRAIQLDPNYATAHHWYGEYLGLQGRFDEAFRELEHARQLDPLSLIIAADKAAVLYYSRDYDRSIEQFRAVLEMEPNFPRAYLVIGPYAEKGMFKEALAQMELWEHIPLQESWSWSGRAYLYGRSGDRVRAQQALEGLTRLGRRQRLDPAAVFYAYVGIGNKEEALFWLERAYAERSPALSNMKVNPTFDPLRTEPRFKILLRLMGL